MAKVMFNLPEYFALHSYLSALLCGSFVLLPRSTPWFVGQPTQSSSADRPEYPFLTPMTSRPLATMVWDLFGMLLCMSWWGSRMRRWWAASVKKVDQVDDFTERMERNKQMLQCSLSILATSVVIYVLLVTLGAPIDSHHFHTALLAMHLSILTVWPVVQTLGVPSIYDSGTYARFRMTRLPETPLERALVYPVIGTLVGAWVGVVPIPLDWDRPFQSYPLTPTVGSILGFIAGGFASWVHSALLDTFDEVKQQQQQQVSHARIVEKRKNKRSKRT
ncbi:uncharacterized protein IL334_007801 [Kwoniella shivajii]|uniref:Phosphatidylinositol glycan, class F n=1 Tax=Kwoniella shivajii TaxID=564305 RepID=A0ABZ1DB27_9TREE|nr:hypothetical protein IL334_007801 [Kwoniella shivajii]